MLETQILPACQDDFEQVFDGSAKKEVIL